MIAMAPPRPSRPAAHPQPAQSEQPRVTEVPPTAEPAGQLRHSRFRLTPGVAAAAEAREHIRTAIRTWQVPVDAEVAVLLASELVTNAITHGQSANGSEHSADGEPASAGLVNAGLVNAGLVNAGPVMLSVRCSRGELRVEVHDRSRDMPPLSPEGIPAESETGRGLMLVAALAARWGSYRTPSGKAVYFTLTSNSVNSVPPTELPRRGDGEP
jgi:anti-sigma regulatory factor (Ser/Thr protein kinase)